MSLYLYENELEENLSDAYTVELLIGETVFLARCFHATVRKEIRDEALIEDCKIAPLQGATHIVDGRTSFLYKTSYCRFDYDFKTPLKVRVTPKTLFSTVRIRPWKSEYTVKEGAVEFALEKPSKISIEFDGNIYENLCLFADLPETETPSLEDPKVIYFGKGVHDAGNIVLTNGQTLYLAGGSYVYGCVQATGTDITVCGRGVLCASKLNHDLDKERKNLFLASQCERLTIKDILMVDSPSWTVRLYDSKNVLVDNVKQFSWNENGDGIDVCKSENVEIRNVFLRNSDDNISIKTRKHKATDTLCAGASCRNVYIHDCIFWADKAHCMLVGPEATMGELSELKDIRFENIVCLEHSELIQEYQGVMAIFAADESVIENITWKNIEVYNIGYGRLISVKYTKVYAAAVGKSVKNIRFENIRYYGDQVFPDVILGFDETHTVENVTLENVCVQGVLQTERHNGIRSNEFVKNLRFIEN